MITRELTLGMAFTEESGTIVMNEWDSVGSWEHCLGKDGQRLDAVGLITWSIHFRFSLAKDIKKSGFYNQGPSKAMETLPSCL